MIVGSSTGFPPATYAFPTAYADFDKTVEGGPKHNNGADQTHSVAALTTGCVINLMHLWRTLRKIILPAVLAVLQLCAVKMVDRAQPSPFSRVQLHPP
jgi:hypothetical protein